MQALKRLLQNFIRTIEEEFYYPSAIGFGFGAVPV
jgi:hypothetical protein